MILYRKAYLFQGGTVVLDKAIINNAKDDEFEEITLLLSKEQIEQLYAETEDL